MSTINNFYENKMDFRSVTKKVLRNPLWVSGYTRLLLYRITLQMFWKQTFEKYKSNFGADAAAPKTRPIAIVINCRLHPECAIQEQGKSLVFTFVWVLLLSRCEIFGLLTLVCTCTYSGSAIAAYSVPAKQVYGTRVKSEALDSPATSFYWNIVYARLPVSLLCRINVSACCSRVFSSKENNMFIYWGVMEGAVLLCFICFSGPLRFHNLWTTIVEQPPAWWLNEMGG